MTDLLAPIARRQTADINLLYRTLADAIGSATAGQDGSLPLTTIQAADIMRAVDRGLDVIFGQRQGDPEAALRRIVERETALARLAPLNEAVQGMRQAMDRELRDLVESEARP